MGALGGTTGGVGGAIAGATGAATGALGTLGTAGATGAVGAGIAGIEGAAGGAIAVGDFTAFVSVSKITAAIAAKIRLPFSVFRSMLRPIELLSMFINLFIFRGTVPRMSYNVRRIKTRISLFVFGAVRLSNVLPNAFANLVRQLRTYS
jgi:hypothetical protein